MTPQQLIGTGVRLFAVWLAISGISLLSSLSAATGASLPNEGHTLIAIYLVSGIYFAAALALWLFPMVVANAIVPRSTYVDKLSAPPGQVAKVGCALLGVWLFAKAVPSVVWLLLRAFIVVDGTSSFSALDSGTKLEVGVALFEVGIATMLIMKASAFARWLQPPAEEARPSTAESSSEADVL